MRNLAIAIFIAALPIFPAAGAAPDVYLDRPGALERLQRENPDHFRRVAGILKVADEMPCHLERFKVEMAKYDAREARCAVLLMTSYPAKRDLAFKLDDTRYRARITMKETGDAFIPVHK